MDEMGRCRDCVHWVLKHDDELRECPELLRTLTVEVELTRATDRVARPVAFYPPADHGCVLFAAKPEKGDEK